MKAKLQKIYRKIAIYVAFLMFWKRWHLIDEIYRLNEEREAFRTALKDGALVDELRQILRTGSDTPAKFVDVHLEDGLWDMSIKTWQAKWFAMSFRDLLKYPTEVPNFLEIKFRPEIIQKSNGQWTTEQIVVTVQKLGKLTPMDKIKLLEQKVRDLGGDPNVNLVEE